MSNPGILSFGNFNISMTDDTLLTELIGSGKMTGEKEEFSLE